MIDEGEDTDEDVTDDEDTDDEDARRRSTLIMKKMLMEAQDDKHENTSLYHPNEYCRLVMYAIESS